MALTRITKGVIKPNENYDTHNINSTGIVTAIGLDVNGNGDISGNLSVGGVLTYEDVTSIDSVGIITAQKGIHVGAGVSAVGVGTFSGLDISGDIDVDGHTNLDNVSIAGVTTASDNIIIPDNKKLILGSVSGRQLEIFHNTSGSSNHRIQSTSSTNFLNIIATVISPNADTFVFKNNAGNKNVLRMSADTSTKLYYNGNEKLTTENTGVNITGIVTATSADINGDLDVDGHTNLDNVSVAGISTFGVSGISNPFQSDWATKSMINLYGSYGGGLSFNDNGNNGFQLFTTGAGVNFWIKNAAVGATPETSIKCVKDGGVELYNNGTKKFETDGNGITVQGNINMATDSTLQLGVGNDFKLFHNGTTNFIRSANGNIQIDNNSGVVNAKFIPGGASELYHNGTKRFETSSVGANVTGNFGASGNISLSGSFQMPDALQHMNDTTTQIRFPGPGKFSVDISGNEAFRIDSDRRFLHGVTSSIDVCSVAPARLQVHNNASVLTASFTGYGAHSGGSIIALGKSRSNTVGDATGAVQSNDTLGDIRFGGSDGTDMETTACAIRGEVDGSVSSNTIPGRLEFSTNGIERLRVNSSGYIGLGTGGNTSPTAPLSVKVGSNGEYFLDVKGSATKQFGLYYDQGSWGSGEFGIHEFDNSGNPSKRLTIANGGKIGIGFNFNYTMNSDSTNLVIGDGGGAKGITLWTAAGADSQNISFQTNENLSRAEGEISYGPTNTSTATNRNNMMFRTNSAERFRITSTGRFGFNRSAPHYAMHLSPAAGETRIDLHMTNSTTGHGATDGAQFGYQNSAGAYIWNFENTDIYFGTNNNVRLYIKSSTGHLEPGADNTQNLGSSSKRWANIYTGDLQLSNVTSPTDQNGESQDVVGNDVDGTQGTWTIQEGANDLFIINRVNGKKYKFNLTEVS